MSTRISIPPVLRSLTGGRRALEADGATVYDLLADLASRHKPLALHLFDEAGAVRRHIVCIHDAAVVRPAEMRLRKVRPGDEIVITNALAGG